MCRYLWQNDGWQAAEIYSIFLMGESRRGADDGVGEFEIIESFDIVLPSSLRYLLFDFLKS